MSQISGHEPQEQPIFLVQSLLHPLARLCPENAHSGLGLAGTRSMCFSPVEISPLWWCLTWVCDLLSPLSNHLEPLLTFPFPLFVSSACETQVCCRTWRGEVRAMLTVWAIACLGIWGFYPPPISSSQQIKYFFPISRSSVQIWNLQPQPSESWRIEERTREKPCADWWDFPFISEPGQVRHPRRRSRYTGIDFNVRVMSS